METPLEERTIPGITAKQLVVYVGGIIAVIISVMAAFNAYNTSVEKNSQRILGIESRVNNIEERFKTIEGRQHDQDIQIATMKQSQIDNQNRTK